MTPTTLFLRQYGAPILAGLLALGLGLGFWLYISEVNKDRREQAEKIVSLEGTIETYTQDAKENAVDIAVLQTRLQAEQDLSSTRLEGEQDRRTAAERRNSQIAGALNDLRTNLKDRECGIGSDLSVRLRDARTEREASRQSREGSR